jgi:hypothetical protein
VSRRAGLFGFFHGVLVVGVPRIYLGYHYPTDILGGGLLGIAVAGLSKVTAIRAAVTRRPLLWFEIRPDLSYAGFFLLSFVTATTFDPIVENSSLSLWGDSPRSASTASLNTAWDVVPHLSDTTNDTTSDALNSYWHLNRTQFE